MNVLPVSVATTLEFYRGDPSLTMELDVVDQSSGDSIDTPVVTDDATDVSIVAAIEKGDTSFVAASLEKGVRYRIQHNPTSKGPFQDVEIIGADTDGSDLNSIKYPFLYDMAAGCDCKGLRSTGSFTPAAAYAGKWVWAVWTDSNGVKKRIPYLCLDYVLECPITSDDVRDHWPRMDRSSMPKWQQISGVGWQPQIDEVWDKMRDEFWKNERILDRVVSASLLEEAFWAMLEKRFVNMGFDPAKSGDPLREAQNRAGIKAAQLMTQALTIPLQEDTDDNNTNNGYSARKGVRFNFLNRNW